MVMGVMKRRVMRVRIKRYCRFFSGCLGYLLRDVYKGLLTNQTKGRFLYAMRNRNNKAGIQLSPSSIVCVACTEQRGLLK